MDAITRSVLEMHDEGQDFKTIAKELGRTQSAVRGILSEHRGDHPLGVTVAPRDLCVESLLTAGDRSARQRTRTAAAKCRTLLAELQQFVAAEVLEDQLRQRIADDTAALRKLRSKTEGTTS